jgi:hypothetical protein
VDHDLEQGIPAVTYAADKGYDDGDNDLHMEIHGKQSAIRIKDDRLKKKDTSRQVWLDLVQTR